MTNRACVVCNGTYTSEQVHEMADFKTDRKLCQKHIDVVVNLMKEKSK